MFLSTICNPYYKWKNFIHIITLLCHTQQNISFSKQVRSIKLRRIKKLLNFTITLFFQNPRENEQKFGVKIAFIFMCWGKQNTITDLLTVFWLWSTKYVFNKIQLLFLKLWNMFCYIDDHTQLSICLDPIYYKCYVQGINNHCFSTCPYTVSEHLNSSLKVAQ